MPLPQLIVVDQSISKFCKLVEEINTLNAELIQEQIDFYSQGKSFEEQYQYLIIEIRDKQDELRGLLKVISK